MEHSGNFQISEANFQNYLTSPQYIILAAIAPNYKILGYIITQRVLNIIDVIYICVHDHYRRHKIATKLLQCSTWNISAIDVEGRHALGFHENVEIFLEVAVDNIAAIALYQKCGFSILTTRKAYARLKDFYLMARKS
jgi:ribosomal protein S18 acetylase RimI-like enzyme